MGANVSHDGPISRVVRSRIFDDREKCVMGANVFHDGRISRVVRSRIFDDREKCVMGANVSHDGRTSGSYDHVSSTIERNVLWVRMSHTTGAISRVVRSRIFDDREKCVMGANVSKDVHKDARPLVN